MTRTVLASLVLAAVLAIAVAPFASSSPDGLEKVAVDQGFASTATDHDLADGPLADYTVSGVDRERATVSLAGFIGVAATFVVTAGAVHIARRAGAGRAPRPPAGPA